MLKYAPQTNFNKVDVGGLVADSRLKENLLRNSEEKQPYRFFWQKTLGRDANWMQSKHLVMLHNV